MPGVPVALAGRARLGPYEVLSSLGAGGMGEVYRARDTRLDRDVAIKVLPAEAASDAARLKRFEKEARAASALNHPNLVTIYEVDRVDTTTFIVMELVEGKTLRDILAEEPLPTRRILAIAAQIADGLARAHAGGIVHRDLKPENVMVTRDGLVKILDFGLAKLTRPERQGGQPADAETVSEATGDGIVMGTVGYMSPEQASGHPVDFRSDQFSFGSILYELVTGQRSFQGRTAPEILTAIIREEPRPIASLAPECPAPLRWLVERCLSKEPRERYASTEDLARELGSLQVHLSEAVAAADVAVDPTRRRRPVLIVALAAAAALAAAVALLLGVRFVRPVRPTRSLSVNLTFPLDSPPGFANTNPFALSPDGRTFVYVGVRGGRRKLFVRAMDRDEVKEITGTDGAYRPFFSPDGHWIGFFAEKKLKKIPLAGGPPIALGDAPNGRGGTWGPDGTIVFVPSPAAGMQRIPAGGGDPRPLIRSDSKPESRSFPQLPQILPGGERVLFEIRSFDQPSVAAVVSLETGEQRVVLQNAACPRYLPTGHLVFVRSGLLYAAAFDPERLRTTGPAVPLLEDVFTNRMGTEDAAFAFSQEGTLVYAPYEPLRRKLVWVDRKGATSPTPWQTAEYRFLSLSPDGGHVAIVTGEKGEAESLSIGDFGRGTLTRSTAEGMFGALAWTPDGNRIAYGYYPEGKRQWRIFWQSADAKTAPERLGPESINQSSLLPTSFSPDGSVLLIQTSNFALNTPGSATGIHFEIFVLPLAGGGTVHPFVQSKTDVARARFSPDGRWVAYESNESEPASASPNSGRWEVYVQPYPGPGPHWQISVDGGREPRWSRGGRELFYRKGNRVMAVDVETQPAFRVGRPRTLFEAPDLVIGSGASNSYDVSPDSSRFLMIQGDPAESAPMHAKVVVNWFEDVKRRASGGH